MRAAALAAVLALAGCAPAALAPAETPSPGAAGDTIVVGRVELVPPLRKGEQRLQGIGSGRYENLMLLLTDPTLRKLPPDPALADYAGRIEATLGETFFVRSPARPFYVLGGIVFLEVGRGMSRARFPGGLRVDLQPGDRAVYVGTLRYHRDEFFQVSKVSVVDEFPVASAEFRKRFGNATPLRKALMTPAR